MTSKILTLLAAAAIAVVTSCAPTPTFDPETGTVSGGSASPTLVAEGARQFDAYKNKRKVSTNSVKRGQVNRVVKRLAKVVPEPGAPWEVVVFEENKPNAFALPGGKIGVNTGLFQITRNDAGMATVLAHEMAHVSLNHAQGKVNRATGMAVGAVVLDGVLAASGAGGGARAATAGAYGLGAATGVMLPDSRGAEEEADKLGMLYMARAGYDPAEAVDLWRRFAAWREREGKSSAPEFLRTHPLDESRIRELDGYLPVAQREYRR